MKKPIHLLLSSALVILMGSGCAAFPKHAVPEVGQQTKADGSRAEKASYQLTGGANLGAGRSEFSPQIRQQLTKEFVDTLKESGSFATLREGKDKGLHIDADILNHGSGAAAAGAGFLGGLTLCTIPCWATDWYKMKADVTTAQGLTKTYVLDDGLTTVFWLPLAVIAPFHTPEKVSEDVRKNLYKTLVQQMRKDGVLAPAK